MTSQKDEQPPLKLLSKKELPEPLKFSIFDTEGGKSKTLCSLGEENSMMQQNFVKATSLSNEKGILPNTESSHHERQHSNVDILYGIGEHAKESSQMVDAKAGESNEDNNIPLMNIIHEAQHNSSVASQVESVDQKGDFSDDLVNAIKRIESRILAFQLCSNMMDSSKNSAGHHTMHKVANSETTEILRNDGAAGSQFSRRRSLLEGHRLMNQPTDRSSCQSENLEEPFLTGNKSSSQSQVAYQNHGLNTSTESAKNVDIPKQISTHLVSGEELRSRTRIQPSAQNMAMVDRVKSLNRLVSGDTHLGSQASECIQGLRVPLNQDDLTKKPSMFASQTNKESLDRKTPVFLSKTNQNQKERSYASSYAQKSVGSTPTFARREKPPPHQMVKRPTLLDQRSSEIKVNSHQHRDWSVLEKRGTHDAGHIEPRNIRVRPQHNEPEESGHRHSMWKNLQNVFHHKNKHGVLTKQKVEKTRRGAVTRVLPRSNQVGQFHRLVEGLLRHIRHSDKAKAAKLGGVKRSRNTAHRHSQKKLHWWQILRRRRGVKLKNRGQVKMEFMSQKSLKN
ncbi:hypothetical protein SESBI_40573 [Sesbania bispinosa]|nr:hypothetical protein SESBI_40573 [Sesbania bispinosa]